MEKVIDGQEILKLLKDYFRLEGESQHTERPRNLEKEESPKIGKSNVKPVEDESKLEDIENNLFGKKVDQKDSDEDNEEIKESKTKSAYSITDYRQATFREDYQAGDSSLFVPGSYLQIFRMPLYRMGENLFGFTEPFSTYSVVVRGDLKGEAFRRVRDHEAYHWHMKAGEMETRAATGTHMHDFLPILERTRYTV